jgi:hypothetical protein
MPLSAFRTIACAILLRYTVYVQSKHWREYTDMIIERNLLNDLLLTILDPDGPSGVGGLRSG